ncbi:MAG: hypothetical protein K6G89_08130 [Clostridia bacterium]|nr:hypothetical protein [Clostridia bacterium]
MSEGGYKCFKKRDFGQFVYLAVAVSLIGIGILLLVQQDIGQPQILLGLKIVTLVCGVGTLAGYFMNLRTRFRPGWTLATGIIFTLVSAGYLIVDSIETLPKPFNTIGDIILFFSFINSCLLLASAIQIFSLRLKRWSLYALFSLLGFVYFVLLYTDTFSLRANEFVGCAVFMFILAAQFVTEGITDLVKFAAGKNISPEEIRR